MRRIASTRQCFLKPLSPDYRHHVGAGTACHRRTYSSIPIISNYTSFREVRIKTGITGVLLLQYVLAFGLPILYQELTLFKAYTNLHGQALKGRSSFI